MAGEALEGGGRWAITGEKTAAAFACAGGAGSCWTCGTNLCLVACANEVPRRYNPVNVAAAVSMNIAGTRIHSLAAKILRSSQRRTEELLTAFAKRMSAVCGVCPGINGGVDGQSELAILLSREINGILPFPILHRESRAFGLAFSEWHLESALV